MRFTVSFGQLFTVITAVWLLLGLVLLPRVGGELWSRSWRWLGVYACLVVIARVVYFPWHTDAAGGILPLRFDAARILPFKLNLLPFVHLLEKYEGWRRNLFGNIALFVPVGVFWPLCFGKLDRVWKVVLAGFFFSLLIELSQLLFYERSTDIDDLILNTLGVWIGALLFFALQKGRRKKEEPHA